MHHAYGVGVEALFDLSGLESPDVRRGEVSQFDSAKERYQVIVPRPPVAAVGERRDLIASRVREPSFQVLAHREPPRIDEQSTTVAVGDGGGPLVCGLFRRGAVEAYPPASGRRVQGGTGVVSAVRLLPRLRSFAVRTFTPPRYGASLLPLGRRADWALLRMRGRLKGM